MSAWEVWLTDPDGYRVKLLDQLLRFRLSLVANNEGGWEILLPDNFDLSLFHLDSRIEFWRAPRGKNLSRIFTGFFRRVRTAENARTGFDTLHIGGPGLNELLLRWIVAYEAGAPETDKTGYADDILKAIIRENAGSLATDPARDLSARLAVQADTSEAPRISKAFSWREVLATLQDVAAISKEQGTQLWFSINQVGQTFEFRTHVGQIGANYGTEGGNPRVFSRNWGNLENVRVEAEYSDEVTYVYAGGQGEGDDREIVEVSDAQRIAASPFNRREAFRDARNERNADAVEAAGQERLTAGRPRLRFQADLLDTPQMRFQEKWFFGDVVAAEHQGQYYDGMITALDITVDDDSQETINARLNTDVTL